MSSGSRQTVFSVVVLVGCLAFTAWLAAGGAEQRVAAPPVHLVVPPVPAAPSPAADPHTLRVCSDPNNLPFSDLDGRGFENRLAEIIARELDRRLVYYWQPQRRGFLRTTLNAGSCDVVMGVPSTSRALRVTRPYYRSTYVFVSRRTQHLSISSFDDPRLRRLRVGIPITGDDYANPPPAQALAYRHIVDNVRGYPVYGDYSQPRPSWGVLDALLAGDVDVAVAWGPIAGYFARQAPVGVAIAPVTSAPGEILPFEFDMSVGVRRGDPELGAAIDAALVRHAVEIRELLVAYGVPLRRLKAEGRG